MNFPTYLALKCLLVDLHALHEVREAFNGFSAQRALERRQLKSRLDVVIERLDPLVCFAG